MRTQRECTGPHPRFSGTKSGCVQSTCFASCRLSQIRSCSFRSSGRSRRHTASPARWPTSTAARFGSRAWCVVFAMSRWLIADSLLSFAGHGCVQARRLPEGARQDEQPRGAQNRDQALGPRGPGLLSPYCPLLPPLCRMFRSLLPSIN